MGADQWKTIGIHRHLPAADARVWFVGGALVASGAWFSSLGFGARLLAPLFARPAAWRVLDFLIGLTMLALVAMLLMQMPAQVAVRSIGHSMS